MPPPASPARHASPVADRDLVDVHDPAAFLLASGDRVMLASRCEPADADSGAPLLVGALPFDPDTPDHLLAPRHVQQTARADIRAADPGPPVTGEWTLHAQPPADDYRRAVADAVARMADGELEKVVLARSLLLETTGRLRHRALLRRLLDRDRDGYAFSVPLPAGPGQHALLGLTPELLVSKDGDLVASHPLAGSRPRSADPRRDRATAEELRTSDKDRREHALVVRSVADTLAPYCRTLDVPAEPSPVATPTMWHLGTRVRGRLRDPDTSSLSLARALHPTPAVCGTPTQPAREAVADLEHGGRGFYAGAVGWCDFSGDGEWLVAIRCAEVGWRTARLHAGAGLVPGSTPEAELAETSAKFRTLLAAFGIEEH